MGVSLQVCTKLFWRKKYIAIIPIPDPTPSLGPGSVRDLKTKVRGTSYSTTSRSRLRSRPLIEPLTCEFDSSFFCFHELTQNSESKLGFLIQNPINWEDGEKNFRCLWYYPLCFSFFIFSYLEKAYTLPLSHRYLHQYLWIWRQLCHPSRYPIGPWVTSHPNFLQWSSHDAPPPFDMLRLWWMRSLLRTQLS